MIRKTSKIKGNAKKGNERKKKEYCFKAVSRTISCIRADQKADNSTRANKKEIRV
jgi:hypothetical protein